LIKKEKPRYLAGFFFIIIVLDNVYCFQLVSWGLLNGCVVATGVVGVGRV
jgi:hypothetical protein